MNERASYNPTAEEDYTKYKNAYFALAEAMRTLPPASEDTLALIQNADDLISGADIDIDTRQQLLTQVVEAKSASIDARLRIKAIRIIVAEDALQAEEMVSADVYSRKKDEWHEEALAEDRFRSKQ